MPTSRESNPNFELRGGRVREKQPRIGGQSRHGQIVEFTPSRPRHFYLARKTDAGSVPCSTTNNKTPTVLGWGFFLSDRAGSRVLLGVPAEACGLRPLPELAVPGHIPLSPGHSSLRPRSLELARSPQRPQRRPIQIKGLRADESSGWIAALATGVGKRP